MKTISILGKKYHTEGHVVDYFNAGDRARFFGKLGARPSARRPRPRPSTLGPDGVLALRSPNFQEHLPMNTGDRVPAARLLNKVPEVTLYL